MAYHSSHTGPQIDAGINAALNPDVAVTPDSDALVTSGAVAAKASSIAAGMAIIATGNTHAAITKGQYVYIQDHATLAEGMYEATANIAANGTLSTDNVTAKTEGTANALKAAFDALVQNSTGEINISVGRLRWRRSGNVVSVGADLNITTAFSNGATIVTGLPYAADVGSVRTSGLLVSRTSSSEIEIEGSTIKSVGESITGYCRMVLTYIKNSTRD